MNTLISISVIMPVYNADKYIKEAIESVLGQTFQDFELIIIDDASTDKSLEICKSICQGRNNIKLLHLEKNSGQAIARNNGLSVAKGKYIAFIDADDTYTPAALEIMYKEMERSSADFLSSTGYMKGNTPVTFIHGLQKPAKLPDDIPSRIDFFCQGKIPFEVHIKMFRREFLAKHNLIFNDIALMEDTLFSFYALCLAKKIIFIPYIFYLYRPTPISSSRGHEGEEKYFAKIIKTILQGGKYLDAFFQKYPYFNEHPKQAAKAKTFIIGHVMEYYLSNMKMYDNPVYFVDRTIPPSLSYAGMDALQDLTDKDSAWLITFLINEIIRYHKDDTRRLLLNNNQQNSIERKKTDTKINCVLCWEFLRIDNDTLNLEGFISLSGIKDDDVRFFIKINNDTFTECEVTSRKEINRDYVDKYISPPWNFKAEFKNISRYDSMECRFYARIGTRMIAIKGARAGFFFPTSNIFHESYAMIDNWMLKFNGGNLLFIKSDEDKRKQQESKLLAELEKLNSKSANEAIFLRRRYHELKPKLQREVWLISDRINKACDNGEALFKYLSQNGCPADTFFLLKHDSPDYSRLQQYGKVVDYLSIDHKLIHLLADKIISSHADEYVSNPFFDKREFYRDILYNNKYIFLQHGIIQNNLSNWLNRHNKNLSLFITSAFKEYESILKDYYYDNDVVRLTGMPRYDYLENHIREKIIAIMPTWRHYLIGKSQYNKDGLYIYNESFRQSTFFKFYNNLLNSKRLLDKVNEYGYHIKFMPHPNLMTAMPFFEHNPQVEFCSLNNSYNTILGSSKLLITDYSSVSFDFSYLRKPIIYCHFDYDYFINNHTYTKNKECFDYPKDGFGEIAFTLDETIDYIISYMENDCKLKDIYRKRIDSFFAYHDHNNCQRVIGAITNIH